MNRLLSSVVVADKVWRCFLSSLRRTQQPESLSKAQTGRRAGHEEEQRGGWCRTRSCAMSIVRYGLAKCSPEPQSPDILLPPWYKP